jgi:hypothetical protein
MQGFHKSMVGFKASTEENVGGEKEPNGLLCRKTQ